MIDDLPEVKDMSFQNYELPKNVGFQATELERAASILRTAKKENATMFLTFTANLVASGLRGLFTEMCKKKMCDIIITTPGAFEHDVMKTFGPYYIASFNQNDEELHKQGINRIGNILVPNDRYVALESFMYKVFDNLETPTCPSEIAEEMGKQVNDPSSFLYWCYKNNIPVFAPGITDGAIGLNAYFYKQKHKSFSIDVTKDMNRAASVSLNAEKTCGLIIGGGISKHHALGLNLLRGGFDYTVYLTTANEWDGSLSGARPREAKSWGKIKEESTVATVYGDATITLPLLISEA